MTRYLLAYGAAALAFLIVDVAWIGLFMARLYKANIAEIMSDRIRIVPAVLFYVIHVAAIVILAVRPALASGSWEEAALLGAVLGLAAYGAYALTDHSIMKVWDIKLTLADMAWGTFASALAATVAFFAARQIGR
jgi:uncharacterized membrane protein